MTAVPTPGGVPAAPTTPRAAGDPPGPPALARDPRSAGSGPDGLGRRPGAARASSSSAIFDETFASQGPNEQDIPGRLRPPSWSHPFGTDDLGRDILSRVILGASVSLKVGFLSVGLALVVGTLIGLFAGFYGRWVDDVLMRIMDMLFAFPAVLLAIAILAVRGPGSSNTIIAIASSTCRSSRG